MSAEADRYIADLDKFKRDVFWPELGYTVIKGAASALVGFVVGGRTNFIVGAGAGAGSFIIMDQVNLRKLIYKQEIESFMTRFNSMSEADKVYITHRVASLF